MDFNPHMNVNEIDGGNGQSSPENDQSDDASDCPNYSIDMSFGANASDLQEQLEDTNSHLEATSDEALEQLIADIEEIHASGSGVAYMALVNSKKSMQMMYEDNLKREREKFASLKKSYEEALTQIATHDFVLQNLKES